MGIPIISDIAKAVKGLSVLSKISKALKPLKTGITKWRYHMPDGKTVEVEVKSAWASKINWMEIIKVMVAIAAMFGFTLTPEDQNTILLAVTSVGAAITIVLRVFFTSKITPSSAKNGGTQ